jgi:hypothetical protein
MYEQEDQHISDFKQKFKIHFYFSTIDTAIAAVDDKFKHMSVLNILYIIIINIYELQKKSSEEQFKKCLILERYLMHKSSRDIEGTDLSNELQVIARRISENISAIDVLSYICQYKLENKLPNLFIALCIFATLSVLVASSERSFSELKLINAFTSRLGESQMRQ